MINNIEELAAQLEGKTIQKVSLNYKYDTGVVIICTDGTIFEYAYSGQEGTTWLDGKQLSFLD